MTKTTEGCFSSRLKRGRSSFVVCASPFQCARPSHQEVFSFVRGALPNKENKLEKMLSFCVKLIILKMSLGHIIVATFENITPKTSISKRTEFGHGQAI